MNSVKRRFGLIGKNISYSFSQSYFSKKFDDLGLCGYSYENFDINKIEDFPKIIKDTSYLSGLNVTIPYKELLFPFLDKVDSTAQNIGAVNTIKISGSGKLKGFNTDWYGFLNSIKPLLGPHHKKALILGTGGASKAVAFVLSKLGIHHRYVSRNPKGNSLTYKSLSSKPLQDYTVVINCSPVGTFPNTDKKPDFPYGAITPKHLFYDLIYNPSETTFLKLAKDRGATVKNGLEMLELQAEKAWEIWQM